LEFIKLKIDQLVHAEYNPRKDLKAGDPEFEKIKNSIENFGYCEPIIVNQDYTIVGGHQRAKVLKSLGYDEVDCVIIDIDKTKEKALNIALNKITGEWDFDALAGLLEELKADDYNIELTGFDFSEMEKMIDELHKDDESEEDEFDVDGALPENPITRKGDIWLLGKHRLMCGDSCDEEDVAKLMDGKKADMVFTDPPWNVNYGASDHPSWKSRTIMNDSMSTEDFKKFMDSVFKCMSKYSKLGCMTYVVMSAQEWGNLMLTLTENNYHWSSTIIWNKDRLVLSRKDLHTKYEPIFYGWLEGAPRLHPLTDRTQSDVWDIPRPSRSDEHPTMKTIELVVRAIKNSSNMKDLVLDLFGGSGTTLIASTETDRACNMMELDPKYADVIVNRYIAHVDDDSGVWLVRDGMRCSYQEVVADSAGSEVICAD
jgi:DNA modification methylase